VKDADIITAVRRLRRLITTFDSIGFPVKSFYDDDELSDLIPDGLPSKIVDVSSDLHIMIQDIEKSKAYKDAIKRLLAVRSENG
jgi:hypothetical protein